MNLYSIIEIGYIVTSSITMEITDLGKIQFIYIENASFIATSAITSNLIYLTTENKFKFGIIYRI